MAILDVEFPVVKRYCQIIWDDQWASGLSCWRRERCAGKSLWLEWRWWVSTQRSEGTTFQNSSDNARVVVVMMTTISRTTTTTTTSSLMLLLLMMMRTTMVVWWWWWWWWRWWWRWRWRWWWWWWWWWWCHRKIRMGWTFCCEVRRDLVREIKNLLEKATLLWFRVFGIMRFF